MKSLPGSSWLVLLTLAVVNERCLLGFKSNKISKLLSNTNTYVNLICITLIPSLVQYITNNATYVFPCTLSNVISVHCDVRYLNCISRDLLKVLKIKIMFMYMSETFYYFNNSFSKAL